MRKYYLHNGQQQDGPYNIYELNEKGITPDTPVWYNGLTDWVKASSVEELATLFSVPPKLSSTTPPPLKAVIKPKKGKTISIVGIVAVVAVLIIVVILSNNPNSLPSFNVEVNSPKPVVVTTRADGSKSGLFNARTTVYATVQNQGGAGNVFVTFYVTQGKKKFDKGKAIFLEPNQSEDLQMTFEEVTYIDGDITYQVEVKSQ